MCKIVNGGGGGGGGGGGDLDSLTFQLLGVTVNDDNYQYSQLLYVFHVSCVRVDLILGL